MTDLEKIAYAKSFIDQLAEGVNPLDGTPIPEGDIANNVRLSRCFFYVSDILRQVIDNGGVAPVKAIKTGGKPEFSLSAEAKEKFEISDAPIYISDIVEQLNALSGEDTLRLPTTTVTGWLAAQGFLETVVKQDGKNTKRPTAQGESIGILTEERSGMYGPYTVVLYTAEAQGFILDHLDAIIDYRVTEKMRRKEEREERKAARREEKQANDLSDFYNRPWTPEHDARLTQLFYLNITIPELAHELRRTEEGVRARLSALGLLRT